jgi:ABC-2 type transport system permease protein
VISLRSLLKLTWLELKIFAREPLGFIGGIVTPLVVFVVFTRMIGPGVIGGPPRPNWPGALGAVGSLITIVSIYREGGILKRLRATPLRPTVILSTHVVVKLLMTAVSMMLMYLAGRRYVPAGAHVPYVSFAFAALFATWSILSIGFVVASLVPSARFAQPLATFVLYPMLVVSGLFFPVTMLPPVLQAVAKVVPLTYAVSLLSGIWRGDAWLAHRVDIAALLLTFVVCTAVSARVFRWE